MSLAARESEIYFSMASLSGTESEYNLPLGERYLAISLWHSHKDDVEEEKPLRIY